MYDRPPQTFAELFSPFPEEISELGKEARNRIRLALPEAEERVYGGKKVGNVLYSVDRPNNVLCGIQPGETFIRVFFHQWEILKQAGYPVEGTGKNARHVKIKRLADFDEIDLAKMVSLVSKNARRVN